MLHTVTAEVRQIAVNIRQRDAGNEGQIHVANVDLTETLLRKRRVALLLQITEKIPQIQIVFVHRALGVRLDGLVVAEEIQQQLGRILTVVHSVCFERSRLWSASRGNSAAESRSPRAGTVTG